MCESTIEQAITAYVCLPEDKGGLGYSEKTHVQVRADLMMPYELAAFAEAASPEAWKKLKRKYNNNENKLAHSFADAVRRKLSESQNVAIGLNSNKSINFEGERIALFVPSASVTDGETGFRKNRFTVVRQVSHKIVYKGREICTIRPDLAFFLNGIYIGSLELKNISQNQTAEMNGRTKVVCDYLDALKSLVELGASRAEIHDALFMFEGAIHLTTTDIHQTYVLRALNTMRAQAVAHFTNKEPEARQNAITELMREFKLYPEELGEQEDKDRVGANELFHRTMAALYGKRMIEKEILYYNFIAYRYKKLENSKDKTTNTGTLIAPRPKQKFGCEKVMKRLNEMLAHEQEPDYYLDRLRDRLTRMGVSSEKIEEVLAERVKYHNNQRVYSLLMQYAAGFGKSNIIGWLALQLKDLRYNNEYVYNKVLLVVDRLQLRDQLDTNMRNMNIDNSLFTEAKDKKTFIDALSSNKRIIVVNIQKFQDLQEAIDQSGTELGRMRVAFLIDEIHRSNSGEQHAEMINLFERLQDSFPESRKEKKNLIVGFTATADDATLVRFGELLKIDEASLQPIWVPFDCYSMQEAIADGYILDPTQHILPYAVPVEFVMPEELEDKDKGYVTQRKADVYEFEPRMRAIAQMIVERLVTQVYTKIRGEGKAMLAVSSIPLAIRYSGIIKELYAEKCQEPRYSKYAEAPIITIYSDNQQDEPCSGLNDGITETRAIDKFKSDKNGLIIVVDKLQTGFDEPKLHTLFLDKEITGINAIQTISRVNRTMKRKEECHIIDCTWKNVNGRNIKEAFAKYCGMNISHFSAEGELTQIEDDYNTLIDSEVYSRWWAGFSAEHGAEFIIEMEDGIRRWINDCCDRERATITRNTEGNLTPEMSGYERPINPAALLYQTVSRFGSTVNMLHKLVEIDSKYTDETFRRFWKKYCNIFRSLFADDTELPEHFVICELDEVPGFTVDDTEVTVPAEARDKRNSNTTGSRSPKEKSIEDILECLNRLNESERLTAAEARRWMNEVSKMFETLRQDEDLCTTLEDEQTSEDEKRDAYNKAFNAYKRSLRLNQSLSKRDLEMLVKLLDDNADLFYENFVNIVLAGSDLVIPQPTVEPAPEEPFDMEKLRKLILAEEEQKRNPEYNEEKLSLRIKEMCEADFENLPYVNANFDKAISTLFAVLNTNEGNLTGTCNEIRQSLNILLRGDKQTVGFDIRKDKTKQLALAYEPFLKHFYFVLNGEDVPFCEKHPENIKHPTKIDCIYAFPAVKMLYKTEYAAYIDFEKREKTLFNIADDARHAYADVKEEEIEDNIREIIDMYLFVVGKNILNFERRHEKFKNESPILQPEVCENTILESGLAAESNNPEETVSEVIITDDLKKKVQKAIVELSRREGKKFDDKYQWVGIYRALVDNDLCPDNDFEYFKKLINKCLPYSITKPAFDEVAKEVYQSVYARPLTEWNIKEISALNRKHFSTAKSAAKFINNQLNEEA